MYSQTEIVRLARAFCEHTGFALSTLSDRACGNDKVLVRLAAGADCHAGAIARASEFFDLTWPLTLDWPQDVARPSRIYSPEELARLATAFCNHTGFALSTLSDRVVGNDKTFIHLVKGRDCRASAAERATEFFNSNWPIVLPWPDGVRRHMRGRPKPGGQKPRARKPKTKTTAPARRTARVVETAPRLIG